MLSQESDGGDESAVGPLTREWEAIPHDLRHSATTLLIAQAVSIKMVSELLGHSTTRMTLNVYSHVLHPIRQDAAERMYDFLGNVGA